MDSSSISAATATAVLFSFFFFFLFFASLNAGSAAGLRRMCQVLLSPFPPLVILGNSWWVFGTRQKQGDEHRIMGREGSLQPKPPTSSQLLPNPRPAETNEEEPD